MARSPAGPPPPDLPASSSTSHSLDWPPPSALQSYIIGGLFGALLFAAGALLCLNGYRSLGRLSRRYGMTPIALLAVLRRHTPYRHPNSLRVVLVVAVACSPLALILAHN